jgi:2',3'-cyclic-nucleotide 2'-phosphodiesterase (5'-nucleotidase family)
MKRTAGRIIAVVTVVLGLAVLGSAQQAKILTILHTNDTHSTMMPFAHRPLPPPFTGLLAGHMIAWPDNFLIPPGFYRDYAGIARMATLIKRIRMTKRNVLALNAGDVFVGSFEFNEYLGYPELKIMEQLYDAMELGNHEFDLGLGALAGVVTGALANSAPVGLPLLCANFAFANAQDPSDPGNILAQIVKPSIEQTVNGIKVGIFGIGNDDPINYSPATAARFSPDPLAVAAGLAADLRKDGCRVVICVSHQGTSRDIDQLSQVDGIDIIVGGHSHELFKKAVIKNGTIIVQAGDHGMFLGELQVSVDDRGVKFLNWQAHELDHSITPDPAVQTQLAALQAGILQDPRFSIFGDVYADRVATAVRTISRDIPADGNRRDAALSNLVTDAMRTALQSASGVPPVDCVLDAVGYTEFGIPAGKIVGNDIMRAVPYGYDPASGLGFKVVITALPTELLLGGLEYSLAASLGIQASGLTFAYDSSLPPSQYLGQISQLDPMSVKVGGIPVLTSGRGYYFVGMSDQVFNFLNALVGGALTRYDPNPPIFEYAAVRSYIQSLGTVDYKSEGRIIDTAAAPTAVRRH